jgi:uncharacterized protein YecE (DUF72 family)
MNPQDLETFHFRDLHTNIFMGTTSDRYAGWIGQIYSPGRYAGRITRRTNVVGGKKFVEEVLPVDSVEEYFEHFRILEIDYTFYRPLTEPDGTPTSNYHVLKKYSRHLKDGDGLILKVPQALFAQKLRRAEGYVSNSDYLNPDLFIHQFYNPAREILGKALAGLLFEQEYQKAKDMVPADRLARSLARFFEAIPQDNRYHIELRTEAYLTPPVFEVFRKHGIGQVISHWTWLPPLGKQFAKAGNEVFNSGRVQIVRLVTPLKMRYEEAYAKAHPFDKMVPGMLQPKMVQETARLMRQGIAEGFKVYVLTNNRSGGNAPLITQGIARAFGLATGELNQGQDCMPI